MKLNNRLRTIAAEIPYCQTLADIGTDHGYIPIYAVKNRICRKALASDLRIGPLEKANENIRRYVAEGQVETRLGNGLEPILHSECDVIVISGMGGLLIKDILSKSFDKAKQAELLLLQPNNAADALRKWLSENGFDILAENLALDAGKIYCVISAKWTGSTAKKDDFSYYVGENLLTSGNPLLTAYLEKKLKELDTIITGREKAKPDKVRRAPAPNDMDTETCIMIRDRIRSYLETM